MAMQIKIIMMFVAGMLFVNQKQNNRCIMIFADKAGNPNVAQQLNILKADPLGTKNRDITFKVITYSADNVQHYKKWGVPNLSFTVLLIGKDSGEKLRSHQPVTLAKLYDLIDNMPMRKQEAQNQH